MTSIKKEAFCALRKSLCSVRTEFCSSNVILCPICLREITESDVTAGGIEHIIPQNVIKADPETIRNSVVTLNQRCGITVLCRQQRKCRGDGKTIEDGCNGLKGRLYDKLFKGMFDTQNRESAAFSTRHKVAILVMAYLGTFQHFGYGYALSDLLAPVREQFDYPDVQKIDWLSTATYQLNHGKIQFITSNKGHPFLFLEDFPESGVMTVKFRRCSVQLPKPPASSVPVDFLESLLRDIA